LEADPIKKNDGLQIDLMNERLALTGMQIKERPFEESTDQDLRKRYATS
jgi:hypothetical protein